MMCSQVILIILCKHLQPLGLFDGGDNWADKKWNSPTGNGMVQMSRLGMALKWKKKRRELKISGNNN